MNKNLFISYVGRLGRALVLPAFLMLFLLNMQGVSGAAFLDPASAQCMGCHDAVIASDVTLQICSDGANCDHPVGVDYVSLAMNNPALRSPFNLNPAITLLGNSSIGCETCHVPYDSANHAILTAMRRTVYPTSPDPMLVMDNRISQLCLACHIK